MRYFKTYSEEDDRGADDDWGSCTYYMEFQDDGKISRIIELYQKGNRRLRSTDRLKDPTWETIDDTDVKQITMAPFLPYEISAEDFLKVLDEIIALSDNGQSQPADVIVIRHINHT